VLKDRWQKDNFSSNNLSNGIEFDDEEEEGSEGIRLKDLYKTQHHPVPRVFFFFIRIS